MDKTEAKKIVQKANPKYTIVNSYQGIIADESVFAFRLTDDSFTYRLVVVYNDKTIAEPSGPMAATIVRSLTEV